MNTKKFILWLGIFLSLISLISCSGESVSNEIFKTGGVKGYDENTVFTSLNNNRPVLARGCSKKIREKFLGITYNTYFDKGVFNSNEKSFPSDTKSDEPYNYQYQIKIVPNIYR